MPKIVLREDDRTTTAVAGDITDVVFVPGFADTNFNTYIVNYPDIAPDDDGTGNPVEFYGNHTPWVAGDTIHKAIIKEGRTIQGPSIFTNTFDKKAWKWTGLDGWDAIEYVEPSPMNIPTYVGNTNDFDNLFGKAPYTWKASSYADQTAFDQARALPVFAENELPGASETTHYFYNPGDKEISWIYAKEMIYAGMPVIFEDVASTTQVNPDTDLYVVFVKDRPIVTYLYEQMKSDVDGKGNLSGQHGVFANYELRDMGQYNFKYVTSGGYPVFNLAQATDGAVVNSALVGTATVASGEKDNTIATNMVALCVDRGDCYAIIDHADNILRPWYGAKSLFAAVQEAMFGDPYSRAGMFTPWATYSLDTLAGGALMPASFGYLRTLAVNSRAYSNYFAYAGVNRGNVYGIIDLHCLYPLTNSVAEDLQTKTGWSINPITFVRPYGLTIWGNRTLLGAKQDDLRATNFLNIRNLVCEVQKTAYRSAKVCLFENDTLGTWVKFISPIQDLLNNMMNNGAVKAFYVKRIATDKKAVVQAEIGIVPIYAIEEFYITVALLDDGGVAVEIKETEETE